MLAPVLVKAPLLFHWLIAEPTLLYGGMHSHLHAGPIAGYPPFPTIDPNIAFTSHALGRRAVLDILAGHFPWWNHFEGVGTPLAGEMQAAALFPLTWLLIFADGQLYMHILLQIIAGCSTWALLRRIGCTPLAATAAALAFEFNGTFAWLANAVVNPIPFLPLTLLGIEKSRKAVADGIRGGGGLTTLGLAASLYSGFPEVAYLDGLLILVWTFVRTASLPRGARLAFLLRVCIAGVAALAISAPALVPFFDYLPLANTGGHAGDSFLNVHLDPLFSIALLSPYAFGGIFAQAPFAGFWGSVGGYAGCTIVALAVAGLSGPTHRGLRLALALWIVVCLALSYGVPGVGVLLHIVPGLKLAAFFRYLPPSWEFCLCILAAFAMTDMATGERGQRLRLGTVVVALGCALAVVAMWRIDQKPVGRFAHIAWIVTLVIVTALLGLAWSRLSNAARVRWLAGMLAFECVLYFFVPVLSYPSRGVVELGGVRFLQDRLQQHRFVTLGPIQPNYGSYFGIASVNHNDLPIPKAWTDFVAAHLDNNAPPILFTGVSRNDPAGPSAADNLIANLDAYRRIGVRYIVAPKDGLDNPPYAVFARYLREPTGARIRPVFNDEGMRIFEIDGPAPYISASNCALTVESRNEVRGECAEASALKRLELSMKGWHAKVNGMDADIATTDEIFQSVAVPKGPIVVQFEFVPPFMQWAWIAFVVGLAIAATQWLRGLASGRRQTASRARELT